MKPAFHIKADDKIHASLSKYDRCHDREITRICIEHPEYNIKQIRGDMYTPSRLLVNRCNTAQQREKIAKRKELLTEFIAQNERNKNYYVKKIDSVPHPRSKEDLELIEMYEYKMNKLCQDIKLDDEITAHSVFDLSYQLQLAIRESEIEIVH